MSDMSAFSQPQTSGGASVRYGVVTATSPLAVLIGKDTVATNGIKSTVGCQVGNRVLMLYENNLLTVVGIIGGGTTSLFSGAVDGSGNVTLSQTIMNFPYLTIFYKDNDGYIRSTEVCVADCVISTSTSSASKYSLETFGGLTTSYLKRRVVYFYSSTSLRSISTQYVQGATTYETWADATNQIVITRVVGHY